MSFFVSDSLKNLIDESSLEEDNKSAKLFFCCKNSGKTTLSYQVKKVRFKKSSIDINIKISFSQLKDILLKKYTLDTNFKNLNYTKNYKIKTFKQDLKSDRSDKYILKISIIQEESND